MISVIKEDIKDKDYRLLIEVAAQKCNRFAFVKNRQLMADEKLAMANFYKLVEDIQDSFISMKEQSEWETTILLESTAYVFYYELNEKTKEFLQTKSNSLFGWISPYLPEDLMLYKDDQVWVVSCSHENWFSCDLDVEINNNTEFINWLKKEYKS
ncbi:MAG: stage III sporulation protein AH [Bacillus sp. (in: firmicutes)]